MFPPVPGLSLKSVYLPTNKISDLFWKNVSKNLNSFTLSIMKTLSKIS